MEKLVLAFSVWLGSGRVLLEPTRPGTRLHPYPRPRVPGTRHLRVPGFLKSGEPAEPCLRRGWASAGHCRNLMLYKDIIYNIYTYDYK
ncbi:hypothetical protein F5880DRAFT_1133337 [Lentinula raphanica]|nr:hypothetical protein F5880DRAFT_1133337 [Lentinula raphanica]